MKRLWFALVLALWIGGTGCRKTPGTEPSGPLPFSLILRITPTATRVWLWDTGGMFLSQAQIKVAGREVPYVPDSGYYFLPRGLPSTSSFLVEVRGIQEDPWLKTLTLPPFRHVTILAPSEGEVYPRNADLYVYWLLDAEPTRGVHQLLARYRTDPTWRYVSDSLPVSQTFGAVPGSLLQQEDSLEILVCSGMYHRLEGLPEPPPHPTLPLDFGGSYAAVVLSDTVTVSIGYPNPDVEVWRGILSGRGTGTWNRVDSVIQVIATWADTSEFFQNILASWPPSSDTLSGSGGDTLILVADSLTEDSVRGWFRLFGVRSDSGTWSGFRVP